jgi:ribosomal silencing factor RsfS
MEEVEEACETDLIKEVMESIGWSDSFLPIANDKNKQLLGTIKFLGRSKLEHEGAFEAHKRELIRVEELFKYADNEFSQNLKLLNAHKSQYSTEYHLLKLGEHEDAKFKQMLRQVQKEAKDMRQLEDNFKRKQELFWALIKFNSISVAFHVLADERDKINESMEKMSEGIQWAKTALLEWRQVMLSGDEANKMIEKLCRMDAGKAEVCGEIMKILHKTFPTSLVGVSASDREDRKEFYETLVVMKNCCHYLAK